MQRVPFVVVLNYFLHFFPSLYLFGPHIRLIAVQYNMRFSDGGDGIGEVTWNNYSERVYRPRVDERQISQIKMTECNLECGIG